MGSHEELCGTLVEWEKKHHKDVVEWVHFRSALPEGQAEILDFSGDSCIFSQLLAEKMKAKKLVAANRSKDQPPLHKIKDTKTPLESKNIDISGESYDHVGGELGKYDLIICKEMLYGLHDLSGFFEGLKGCLKSEEESRVFIVTRPKNPPVPLPDPSMAVWRKLAPGRDEIITAAEKAGFKQDFYSASCPIRVEKEVWKKILLSRCIPAIRFSPKTTDKEIREFISTRPKQMNFEEKVLIIVLWLKGERPEESDLVANKDEL